MPITRSAKKALRQNKRRRSRNVAKMEQVRVLRRKILNFVASGKKEEAAKTLTDFYKAIDKAVKTGVIGKNTASRKKSRISKAIQKVK